MKTIILLVSLSVISSLSVAKNLNICRDQLLGMIGADASVRQMSVNRLLVGTVLDADVQAMPGQLTKGGPCSLQLTVYQGKGYGAVVSVSDTESIFNPFNHNVPADSSSASCPSGVSSVVGSYTFTQDSGWHSRFGTQIIVIKNLDSTFTLSYKTQESGASNMSVTCRGTLY